MHIEIAQGSLNFTYGHKLVHIEIAQGFSNLYKNADFSIDFQGCYIAVEVYPTISKITIYTNIVYHCQTRA